MKTIWLLDVDGVINAPAPDWHQKPYTGYAYSGGQSYKIRWAPSLADEIRAINELPNVEVWWSTTWCNDADQIERLLGLPKLGRAFVVPEGLYCGDLKAEAAQDVLGAGNRLVWTDDTEVPKLGPWYNQLTTSGRALLIRPDARKGLTIEDIAKIREFVTR